MIGKRFRPLPFIFSLFANDNYTLRSNIQLKCSNYAALAGAE